MTNKKFINLRLSLGLDTQSKAAEAFEVHVQTIKSLDRGGNPDLDTLIKMQDYIRRSKGYDVDIISIFK